MLSAHDHKSVHFSADIESGERMLVEALLSNHYANQVCYTDKVNILWFRGLM